MGNKKKKYNKIAAQGNIGRQPDTAGTKTIILTQTRRGNIDIGDYLKAIKGAENVDFPSWAKLYDIYEDVLTDAHLSALIQKRKSAVLNTPIEFRRNGVVDEKIAEQIRSPWFRSFLSDLDDTVQWGNSTFQFFRNGEWLGYDLIPRKHVNPVKRIILKRQTDLTGDSFDDYADLVSIGNPRDLGILAKAALYVIYKRNATADWAQFIELYAHPLKEGIYDGWDEEARIKMTEDLYNMGGSAVILHPKGTEVKIHDTSSKSASSDLYKSFVQYCNDELSKLELGNTLTTEAGDTGTQALGTVHQKVEDKIEQAGRQMILDVLNYELTDVFTNLGMNTAGGEFYYVVPQDKDLSARILIDMQLKNSGLPMSDDYFYETYGVDKPDNYEELKKEKAARTPDTDVKAEEKKETEDDTEKEDKKDGDNDSQEEKADKKKDKFWKNFFSGLSGFFPDAPDKGKGAGLEF